MRGFIRSEVPEFLVEKGSQWTEQWIALRQRNADAKFPWYQHEKKSVRDLLLPLLRNMTAGHCSFCDAFPLEGQSNEPIEHFRPKSVFPLLAYTWSNLYYCCEKCQSSKGEKWPDDVDVIAPDDPGYRWSDWFEFDYTNGQLRPNKFANELAQNRAAETIKLYGLGLAERARRRILELKKWNASDEQLRNIDEFAYRDYLENS
jgi:uncharacterized protein (TIGR02646 family)